MATRKKATNIKHVAGPLPVPEKERIIEFRLESDLSLTAFENGKQIDAPYLLRIVDGRLMLYANFSNAVGIETDRGGRIKLAPSTASALGITYKD